MAYLGTPIDTRNTFQSLEGKRFNGDGSTTAFTLDSAPGNVLDIEVFVGNVRQDPNSAYTLSGTTLTFTGAPPSGTNNIYVVHQAKSVGTIDVPAGGVAAGSLATSVLTGQTDIGAAIADADLFLIDDGAGGTLRKTAASRIKTYVGDNTPAFQATAGTTAQTLSHNTWTKMNLGTEVFDTDSAFGSNKFTVPSGEDGKYSFTYGIAVNNVDDGEKTQVKIYKNGSSIDNSHNRTIGSTDNQLYYAQSTQIVDLDATDYIELYGMHEEGGSQDTNYSHVFLSGYKLIGV